MPVNNSFRAFIINSPGNSKLIDGSLSLSYGFMPERAPQNELPKYFKAWDSIIEEVPTLYYLNKTQQLIESPPLLNAYRLEDDQLSRASSLLSILASAYWRHGLAKNFNTRSTIENGTLPRQILEPWIVVSDRLGRGPRPYQSCYDLFLKNFKLRDNKEHRLENMRIENLDVHLKSFNNECERVFYMSFVEIHSLTSYIIADICDIEDTLIDHKLIKQDQFEILTNILVKITGYIKASITSLTKISPIRSSKTYCDPILWAKTVGVFAIPPGNFVQGGTSGTSTPIVHVLDSLIGRKKHTSYYGEYIRAEGEVLLPTVIKEFTKLTGALKLRDWIESHVDPSENYSELVESYNDLVETYAGKQGFLDKHISKVFNYLGVATMVGRNQSTSGHQRFIAEETWVQVANELRIAQYERTPIEINIQTSEKNSESRKQQQYSEGINPELPGINYLEVSKHYKKADAWIILHGGSTTLQRF